MRNPAAFPSGDKANFPTSTFEAGMTLRDYFAGQALANPTLCTGTAPEWQLAAWFGKNAVAITRDQIVARQAAVFADAMLKARTTPINVSEQIEGEA